MNSSTTMPMSRMSPINSFTLLAIPFFVLAGELMNTGGIAARLVDAAKVLVPRSRGRSPRRAGGVP
jgi:TRAP-type C4-dicarboxylate transport system permease large subunit